MGIGEARSVFNALPKGLPMKTTPSPLRQGPRPLPAAQARQLCMRFETTSLQGITAQQREAVTRALTAVLLQAAGVPVKEDDDDRP